MILYISSATSYQIYDKLFNEGYIKGGYQAQKFNDNIIKGLAVQEKLVALAALPYVNTNHNAIYQNIDGIDCHCIKNRRGRFVRKITKIKELIKEGEKIIRKERPRVIICDAIIAAVAVASIKLGKKNNIPVIGIVTDVPEKMVGNKMGITGRITAKYMKKYDGYILLTEAMNEIVNPKGKPYMIMEGACGVPPELSENKVAKKIILYSGSLWKKEAGLEYLTEGFIKANIPNAELHFYGTGAFVEDLIEISKKHKNVKYMGCITNAEMVKRQAEATLLVNPRPSNAEFCKYSFPSKTFEYMASGTPVFMTKLPGIPKEYFDYVYCIEKETSEEVEKQLKKLMEQDEELFKQKGLLAREFIIKNKSACIQTQRIIKFLNLVK